MLSLKQKLDDLRRTGKPKVQQNYSQKNELNWSCLCFFNKEDYLPLPGKTLFLILLFWKIFI